MSMPPYTIAAFYQFTHMDDADHWEELLRRRGEELGLLGTLLLANEGINATIAGRLEAVEEFLAILLGDARFAGMAVKYSSSPEPPFGHFRLKRKREIVSFRQPAADPRERVGTYVKPDQWNSLITSADVVTVDTRNAYEVKLGKFTGAIDPGTDNFTEFAEWVRQHRKELENRKVAMYCTGGIRCEKATALVKAAGFDDVYHLDGGILRYLEEMPAQESLWQGECFVFDERVSVTHGLERGEARLCRACRRPLTPEERASPLHVEGISCVHCHGERADDDRARYAERQRQVELAERRGAGPHVGRQP